MKNVTTSASILAAVALTFGVTTALAQNPAKLTAEIPFSFHAGNQEYAAGTYETSLMPTAGGARVLKILNVETGAARLAMAANNAYPNSASEKQSGARLVFKCAGSDCALAQIWMGSDTGMLFRTRSAKGGESMHIAVIRLRTSAAD
jgi:hypothetical protein